HDPVLGHITTFGGHPVSCAAGKAAFEVLLQEKWIAEVKEKGLYLKNKLQHPAILQINEAGLWISLQFESGSIAQSIAHACVM
ncbi:aminotransferase class III-fold pyridoxal phosphate-dependent enzyme, partial [Acinetobacter baumannii]